MRNPGAIMAWANGRCEAYKVHNWFTLDVMFIVLLYNGATAPRGIV